MEKTIDSQKKEERWRVLLGELSDTLEHNDRRFNLIQSLDHEIQRTTNDPSKVFDLLFSEGLKEVDADYGHIMIREGNYLVIKYSSDKSVIGTKLEIDDSVCGTVFKNAKSQKIPNIHEIKHYHKIHEDTTSELAIPINDSRGVKIFGIFNVEWRKETIIPEEDLNFCNLLNGQIAITMEQVKLWQGVQMISELSNELLLNKKRLEEVYSFILNRILSILDFDLGQILLVDNKNLIIVASSITENVNSVVNEDNSVCGLYIFGKKGKKPLNINDIEHPSFAEYKKKYNWFLGKEDKKEMRSEFVVPLIGSEDNTIGVISVPHFWSTFIMAFACSL